MLAARRERPVRSVEPRQDQDSETDRHFDLSGLADTAAAVSIAVVLSPLGPAGLAHPFLPGGAPATQEQLAPSIPLAVSEIGALLAASEKQQRERALILLMRYSDLAIGETVALSRESGVRAIEPIRGTNRDYCWWTGRRMPVTCTKCWRAGLGRVGGRAGVEGFCRHRLHDTLQASVLADGVSINDVSLLPGYGPITKTESYCARGAGSGVAASRRPRGTPTNETRSRLSQVLTYHTESEQVCARLPLRNISRGSVSEHFGT